jgi:hypothetical protein
MEYCLEPVYQLAGHASFCLKPMLLRDSLNKKKASTRLTCKFLSQAPALRNSLKKKQVSTRLTCKFLTQAPALRDSLKKNRYQLV